jgi:GT2 family glycosyltransferase
MVGTTTPHWGKETFRERLQAAWFIPRPWRIGKRDIFVTANVAIRANLLRQVGGFGFSEFAGAGEDTELSLRLHRTDARFAVDHSWTVEHDVNLSLRSLAAKYRKYGAANATISSLARVEIPPPAGMSSYDERMSGLPALLRFHRYLAMGFDGNRAARAAAAVTGAWIHSSYVAGYRAQKS